MDCENYREFVNLPRPSGEVSHSDGEGKNLDPPHGGKPCPPLLNRRAKYARYAAQNAATDLPHTTHIDVDSLIVVVHIAVVEVHVPRAVRIVSVGRGRPKPCARHIRKV